MLLSSEEVTGGVEWSVGDGSRTRTGDQVAPEDFIHRGMAQDRAGASKPGILTTVLRFPAASRQGTDGRESWGRVAEIEATPQS